MAKYVTNDKYKSPADVIRELNVEQSPASRAGNTGGTDGQKGESPSYDPYAGGDRLGPLPKASEE